jgi:hypothetical protein
LVWDLSCQMKNRPCNLRPQHVEQLQVPCTANVCCTLDLAREPHSASGAAATDLLRVSQHPRGPPPLGQQHSGLLVQGLRAHRMSSAENEAAACAATRTLPPARFHPHALAGARAACWGWQPGQPPPPTPSQEARPCTRCGRGGGGDRGGLCTPGPRGAAAGPWHAHGAEQAKPHPCARTESSSARPGRAARCTPLPLSPGGMYTRTPVWCEWAQRGGCDERALSTHARALHWDLMRTLGSMAISSQSRRWQHCSR